VSLHFLATGKLPYSTTEFFSILHEVSSQDAPTLDPAIFSKNAVEFVQLCMTKDPEARPSCSELLKHPFVATVDDPAVLREWPFRQLEKPIEAELDTISQALIKFLQAGRIKMTSAALEKHCTSIAFQLGCPIKPVRVSLARCFQAVKAKAQEKRRRASRLPRSEGAAAKPAPDATNKCEDIHATSRKPQ